MNSICKTSLSPSGKLSCHISEDGGSVWMYLKDLEKATIIGDAPVFSLIPLRSLVDFKNDYEGQGAPPLVEGYTSQDAVLPDMNNDRISIVWDTKEKHVDLLLDSRPVSRVKKGKKRGFSIFTIKDGPWGQPWIK